MSIMGNSMCTCCCPNDYQQLLQLVSGETAALPTVGQLNDKEYINWLKATQDLNLMTKALQSFWAVEMKKLHSQLVLQCDCSQCSGSCSAQDVTKKLTVLSCPTGVCST